MNLVSPFSQNAEHLLTLLLPTTILAGNIHAVSMKCGGQGMLLLCYVYRTQSCRLLSCFPPVPFPPPFCAALNEVLGDGSRDFPSIHQCNHIKAGCSINKTLLDMAGELLGREKLSNVVQENDCTSG